MRGFQDGQFDGAPRRRRPRRLSALFAQMARDVEGPVSVAGIRDALGDRSFAALLVLFAALNMIPLPPPSSAILGLPLLIVSAQMACRQEAGLAAALSSWKGRCRADAFRIGDGPAHAAPGPARAHDQAALLAVLAQAGRPGHRRHVLFAGDDRHLADPARQLAAGLLERAARPGPIERDGILFAIGTRWAWYRWRSSPAVVGAAGFANTRISAGFSPSATGLCTDSRQRPNSRLPSTTFLFASLRRVAFEGARVVP